MVLRFFQSGGKDKLDHAQGLLQEMLANDRHSFEIATAALLTGQDAGAVGTDLRDTDRLVNEAEREVRRDLVVHASVHGTSQVSAVLIYMSIVKDVERIGDYAKNIFDVANGGADLSEQSDSAELIGYRDRISEMITEAARAFVAEDADAANALITEADGMQDEFDAKVAALVMSDRLGSEAVPRALLFRYYKRIIGHLMNVLSAVIMPLDRLDYYDEPKNDR
jgi:phosphate transport system protein